MATPVSISEASGLTHLIPVTYRDAQGTASLSTCWLGVNTVAGWTRAVWAVYDAQSNQILLRNIDGTAWSQGATPGSTTVLSNGMGQINCAQTTVTRSGTDLTINWSVTSANPLAGPNRVYAYADDTAGLNSGGATAGTFTDIGSWAITNQTPGVVVPSPALALSTTTGSAQMVSTGVYDANGWGNVRNVWLQVNEINDWTNSFSVYYDAYTNLLYLRSDDATTWLGGFALGSTNTISNSSGTLNCGQTTLTKSGNNFKVNWSVSMKSGALGANTIYSYASDRGGLNTGSPFASLGLWNVSSTMPVELGNPATGYQYLIPVVIIAYLPTTDNVNLDQSVTGLSGTLDEINAKIALMNQQVKFSLEEGSRYHGYKNSSATPAVGYKVVSVITINENLPRSNFQVKPGVYRPDYNQILTRFNAQNFVNNQGVKEFWIWGYHHNDIEPIESDMASSLTGDVSNSRDGNDYDLPIFNNTYVLFNYNYGRTAAEAVHSYNHELELMLSYVNRKQDGNADLWEKNFIGKISANPDVYTKGRCGWTHMPPNTTVDYEFSNTIQVLSDIEDWTPNKTGQLKYVNAATWTNQVYSWPSGTAPQPGGIAPLIKTEIQWYIYGRQNIPGQGNNIAYGSSGVITNWWQFIGNWDNSIRNGVGLHTGATQYSPQQANPSGNAS